MGRLIALIVVSIVLVSATDAAAATPPAPIDVSSNIGDDHADVEGRQRLPKSKQRARSLPRPKTLTSLQRVCAADTKDDYAIADVCHRSTTLCASGTRTTPAWIMTAPSTPTPGPNDWTNTGRITCLTPTRNDPATPLITGADFRRLPIPPATITVQPDPATSPTLINIPTNLYADGRTRTLPTTVLGQPVRVRATPSTFTWRYGDGTSNTTTNPGGPYPDLSTGHTFTRPGTYTVRLTTTFTGEYAVAGGPWQPINGTATVASPPARITALQARNQLTR